MKKDTLNRKAYPTDLTDEQWAVIAPLFSGMRQYKYITPTTKNPRNVVKYKHGKNELEKGNI